MSDGADLAKVLGALVAAFGPVGAVALLLSLVVGYFYRRDLLKKLASTKADHDRLLTAVEINARANQAIADALRVMSDGMAAHEKRHQEAIEAIGPKIEHAIADGFHNVLLALGVAARRTP